MSKYVSYDYLCSLRKNFQKFKKAEMIKILEIIISMSLLKKLSKIFSYL